MKVCIHCSQPFDQHNGPRAACPPRTTFFESFNPGKPYECKPSDIQYFPDKIVPAYKSEHDLPHGHKRGSYY